MHFRYAAPIFLITALLGGCSSSDDDGDSLSGNGDNSTSAGGNGNGLPTDDDNSASTSMPAPGFNPNDAPPVLTQFNGNYLMSCSQDPDDTETWLVSELSIQSDLTTILITEYSDPDCTQPTVAIGSTLSLIYPGGTANTSLGEADFIDLTLEGGSFNGTPVPLDSRNFFDLILLDGSTLYFGINTEELDGESAETRPTDIDTESAFVRL